MNLPPASTIETSRLLLRPLELSDADPIQRLFPRFEVVAFMSALVPWPYLNDGALTFIRDVALPAMASRRQWHWSIRSRAEPERLIGVVSLMDTEDDNRGFWLDPDWQGRGFMTEACAAAALFWFDTLGRTVLREPKALANTASRRVSEKSGMRVIRREERSFVAGRLPSEIWEITIDGWRRQTASLHA